VGEDFVVGEMCGAGGDDLGVVVRSIQANGRWYFQVPS